MFCFVYADEVNEIVEMCGLLSGDAQRTGGSVGRHEGERWRGSCAALRWSDSYYRKGDDKPAQPFVQEPRARRNCAREVRGADCTLPSSRLQIWRNGCASLGHSIRRTAN